jgi:hypothetical protein
MIVPSQLALKTHTNLGCAASFATLDKLVDKFTLPPAALPIGDASPTHVIKLAAHSTTSPTPTAMRQSFIMTPHNCIKQQAVKINPFCNRESSPCSSCNVKKINVVKNMAVCGLVAYSDDVIALAYKDVAKPIKTNNF